MRRRIDFNLNILCLSFCKFSFYENYEDEKRIDLFLIGKNISF